MPETTNNTRELFDLIRVMFRTNSWRLLFRKANGEFTDNEDLAESTIVAFEFPLV